MRIYPQAFIEQLRESYRSRNAPDWADINHVCAYAEYAVTHIASLSDRLKQANERLAVLEHDLVGAINRYETSELAAVHLEQQLAALRTGFAESNDR